MNINVGQIVYLLSNRDIRVYPAQVIEEINRKTLSGSDTSYVIMLPDKDKSQVHTSKIDVEIFTSSKELEEKMIENAKRKIGSILESAKELESVFENVVERALDSPDTSEEAIDLNTIVEPEQKKKRRRRKSPIKEKKDEKVSIDLGNGLTGKINMDSISNMGVQK